MMQNLPTVRLGMVSVGHAAYPASRTRARCEEIMECFSKNGEMIFGASTLLTGTADIPRILPELRTAQVNALVLFLENEGMESAHVALVRAFEGPVMLVAAEAHDALEDESDRGDAYSALLDTADALLRYGIRAYVPAYPIGTAKEISEMILDFLSIARVLLALPGLKVFNFGPRPTDTLAGGVPFAPLLSLGIQQQENSELDLYDAFLNHKDDPRIDDVVMDMDEELGEGNTMPDVLPLMAQYELTLLDWAEEHLGLSDYACFANRCMPTFQAYFGFVPCYVHARLAAQGIPVSCEADIYGAVNQFIGACLTGTDTALLSIASTVPNDLFRKSISVQYPFTDRDVFIGAQCGSVPLARLTGGTLSYHRHLKEKLEPDTDADITRGTLEGVLHPGTVTLFRLQSDAHGALRAYIAPGEILPVDPLTHSCAGIFAVEQMHRFYRHVLLAKGFSSQATVAFGTVGRRLFDVLQMIGVNEIHWNHPKGMLYEKENPFA